MKKILFAILLLIPVHILFAQRDTEHWFAPMASTSFIYEFKTGLYFSTDSTIPFPIEIYNNNILLGTVTISKGNPQAFTIPPQMMIATNVTEMFNPIPKGLYTKGTKPYYATFRINQQINAEILTSKGLSGIGKKFYAVVASLILPSGSSSGNFTTGILATEDNTKVTVSGYNNDVRFSNGTTGTTTPSMTFTLNKGNSYIIEGKKIIGANRTGFIGAKIVSDKPISVTNGNSSGQFALSNEPTSSDINMDQSVPVDRLGNEFALIKGNGSINQGTEDALIVAVEDDTKVYVNGNATPIATLNEGQWLRVNEGPNQTINNHYINQGNNHYNMSIKTSKNAYVYQLLTGTTTTYSQAFACVSPLSCLLPQKIDEIGMIDILPPNNNYNIILNITTEKGATVTVNGITPTTSQGPYPVAGNNGWVTYSIPNISGNATINSTKGITASIIGGGGFWGSLGYSGYLTYQSIPSIKQTGECIPNIVLEVGDNYSSYQWYKDGIPIPGATTNVFTPLQSGKYTVRVTGSSPDCSTFSREYELLPCTTETTSSAIVCGNAKITPAFTNPSHIVAPGTVTIITPPTKGTTILNPTTGEINYLPNSGYTGPDSFTYKFCDMNNAYCEKVTLNLTISQNPKVNDTILRSCALEKNPATALFNLTQAVVTTETQITKKYYPSPTDAHSQTNEILNPIAYIAPNGVVYVRVSNNKDCYSIAEIKLLVIQPKLSDILKDKIICMENKTTLDAGPGFSGYEWSTGATTQIIQNVGVGSYWVKLKNGECTTKQIVKVFASEHPVITQINISMSTISINVTGGTPPYRYSIDGINWQDSNIFNNITRGDVTIYVKDNYNCEAIKIKITAPNLINTISPNDDGINDAVDYSILANKPGFEFHIYDRYGTKIYQSNKSNGYKWNGTTKGNTKVPTGTYWYDLGWTEPDNKQTLIKYTGWILVKNRE